MTWLYDRKYSGGNVFFKFHQEIIIIDAGSLTGDTSFRQNTKACRCTAMAAMKSSFRQEISRSSALHIDRENDYLPPSPLHL